MTACSTPLVVVRALGTLVVRPVGGDAPLLTQPRPLAVLLYLTLATPRGLHGRDTLLSLFWPESDQASARHGLRNVLHALRKAVGGEVIVTAGDGFVGVDPDLIQCDVLECEADLAAGRTAAALDRYEGEFLRGFHVADAPEFERWMDAERYRLHQAVVAAARRELLAARSGGSAGIVPRLVQQAVALAPDDEALIRDAIQTTAALGDRRAALRLYQGFAERLRLDGGPEPSSELRSFVVSLEERTPLEVAPLGPARNRSTGPVEAEATPRAAPEGLRVRRRWPVAIGVLALVALVAAWWLPSLRTEPAARIRVAVLPFRTLGTPGEGYFAEGIAAELRNALAGREGIDVIGGISVDAFRDSLPATVRQILGADFLVRGSVQWSGTRGEATVRVVPELIDVRTGGGAVRPQAAVDATFESWFAAEGDIARRIADSLGVPLQAEAALRAARPPTRNLEAYQAFLRGDHDRAIALDSGFSLAWARRAREVVGDFRYQPSEATRRQAAIAVERALTLGPDLVETRFASGLFQRYQNNQPAAIVDLETARRLAPGDAEVAHFLAAELWILGRMDEALAEARRAVALDPRNASAWARLGRLQLWLRDQEGARRALTRGTELPSPPCNLAYTDLHWLHAAVGDTARAMSTVPQAPAEQRIPCAVFVTRIQLAPWLLDRSWRDSTEASMRSADTPEHYYLTAAMNAHFRGDRPRTVAFADSAAARLRLRVAELPNADFLRINLAFAAAMAGHADEARAQSDTAYSLRNPTTDRFEGPLFALFHAEIAAAIGDRARAIRLIRDLLPPARGVLTPAWLRVDPWFASLRQDPEFVALSGR